MPTEMSDFSFKHVDQVDEPTFSASDLKDHLDIQAREIRNYLNTVHLTDKTPHLVPRCTVSHNANQSIANSTDTYLAFNTESIDTDTMHDNTTNNSRITCKTAGDYIGIAIINWGTGTGKRRADITKNRAAILSSAIVASVSGDVTRMVVITPVVTLAANDYVEIAVNQDSGGSLNVVASVTTFSMLKVG